MHHGNQFRLLPCHFITSDTTKEKHLKQKLKKTDSLLHQDVIQLHFLPSNSPSVKEVAFQNQLIVLYWYLTWTRRVMGPLLSTSRISPFLVPTRMCPWPRDMARIEGLSSRSNPVKCMNYSNRAKPLT